MLPRYTGNIHGFSSLRSKWNDRPNIIQITQDNISSIGDCVLRDPEDVRRTDCIAQPRHFAEAAEQQRSSQITTSNKFTDIMLRLPRHDEIG